MSACSESSFLMAVSTLATISVAGMVVGVTSKFNPFMIAVETFALSVYQNTVINGITICDEQ